MILNGYRDIGGYAFEDGARIWRLSGGGDVPVPTPVVSGGLVFLTSSHGRSRPLRAVRMEARRDLNEDEAREAYLAWERPRDGVYKQTPLVLGELLYACSDGGVLSCYDANTGERHYRVRLGDGTFGFSASPVACEDRIYFTAEVGRVFCVRSGPEFELLAESDLGETCLATPAIAGGALFFRTRHQVVRGDAR